MRFVYVLVFFFPQFRLVLFNILLFYVVLSGDIDIDFWTFCRVHVVRKGELVTHLGARHSHPKYENGLMKCLRVR